MTATMKQNNKPNATIMLCCQENVYTMLSPMEMNLNNAHVNKVTGKKIVG